MTEAEKAAAVSFAVAYSAYLDCVRFNRESGMFVWGRSLLDHVRELGITDEQMPSLVGIRDHVAWLTKRAVQEAA
jgi:hypothetical protein